MLDRTDIAPIVFEASDAIGGISRTVETRAIVSTSADNRAVGVAEAAHRAVGTVGWGPGALLLLNEPMPSLEAFGLALRYQVAAGVCAGFGERMYLYEQKPEDVARACLPRVRR